jgi:hypothetical protein
MTSPAEAEPLGHFLVGLRANGSLLASPRRSGDGASI